MRSLILLKVASYLQAFRMSQLAVGTKRKPPWDRWPEFHNLLALILRNLHLLWGELVSVPLSTACARKRWTEENGFWIRLIGPQLRLHKKRQSPRAGPAPTYFLPERKCPG